MNDSCLSTLRRGGTLPSTYPQAQRVWGGVLGDGWDGMGHLNNANILQVAGSTSESQHAPICSVRAVLCVSVRIEISGQGASDSAGRLCDEATRRWHPPLQPSPSQSASKVRANCQLVNAIHPSQIFCLNATMLSTQAHRAADQVWMHCPGR